MPLDLTWVDLAFSCTKGYPGQVKRHSLPFQVEDALKDLVVTLTFAHDCTWDVSDNTLFIRGVSGITSEAFPVATGITGGFAACLSVFIAGNSVSMSYLHLHLSAHS